MYLYVNFHLQCEAVWIINLLYKYFISGGIPNKLHTINVPKIYQTILVKKIAQFRFVILPCGITFNITSILNWFHCEMKISTFWNIFRIMGILSLADLLF